jgi:hypothetical protein
MVENPVFDGVHVLQMKVKKGFSGIAVPGVVGDINKDRGVFTVQAIYKSGNNGFITNRHA